MPAVFIANQAAKGHFPVLADSPYALGCIPNVLVDARLLPFHVITGSYRGPDYNSYAFHGGDLHRRMRAGGGHRPARISAEAAPELARSAPGQGVAPNPPQIRLGPEPAPTHG